MKLRQSQTTKLSLSSTLRSWLPILQADIESLDEVLEPFANENPFITIKSGFEKSFISNEKSYTSDIIESLSISKPSLYEVLQEQIMPPLFPTKKSRQIAQAIIENINEEGYFEGDINKIAKELSVDKQTVEKIRQRFAYIEPIGVGAKDMFESFLFQLNDLDIDNELSLIVKKLINNFENIQEFCNEFRFEEAISIIKKFKNPPAIEYLNESKQIIPDIYIIKTKNGIEIDINSAFYPQVILDIEGISQNDEYVKQKIKSAKDLVDALEMRKATLYKIGLMILEYQYDFFQGGVIKPMKLKDLAEELDRNPSTISRAISNKYLSCNRGVFALKEFFSTAIDENVSSASIKEFIVNLIREEDRKKPISDSKILAKIEEKFGIKIVRRTITKYRKQLGIAGSSERKKLYMLSGSVQQSLSASNNS